MSNPDPPRLDYFAPQKTNEKPKSGPFGKVVGLLGFLLYGLLAAVFDAQTIFGIITGTVPTATIFVAGAIGAFCTWRAIAAFRQLIR